MVKNVWYFVPVKFRLNTFGCKEMKKKSHLIRGQVGHVCCCIGSKNINSVDDVEYLILVSCNEFIPVFAEEKQWKMSQSIRC